MVFEVRPEHDELRATVRALLATRSDEAAVRRDMASGQGWDPDLWQRLAGEVGVAGLAVPEHLGGAGCGWEELGIAMEEAGRSLVCAPLLSSVVLATTALELSADAEAAQRWLPSLADGSVRMALAHQERTDDWRGGHVSMRARSIDDRWTLTGSKTLVVDGSTADVLLVTAHTGRGISLFTVEASAPGVARRVLDTVDLTRRLAAVDLEAAPATCIGEVGEAAVVVSGALEAGCLALALESVGIIERLLELTVAYAKERLQFGRPIGSFQAVKHSLVDVHVDLELARSTARSAASALAADAKDASLQVSIAKAFCTEAASRAAAACLQAHGGIGFTWEHPVHLYLKRAKGNELLLGRPLAHRTEIARRIGLVNA